MTKLNSVPIQKAYHPNAGKFVIEGGYVGQTSVSHPKLPQGGSSTAPINIKPRSTTIKSAAKSNKK
jgi:hypothetical protein